MPIETPRIENIDANQDGVIDRSEFQQTADKMQRALSDALQASSDLSGGAGLGFEHQQAINELISTIQQLRNEPDYSGNIAAVESQINAQLEAVFQPIQEADNIPYLGGDSGQGGQVKIGPNAHINGPVINNGPGATTHIGTVGNNINQNPRGGTAAQKASNARMRAKDLQP